jgi:hypothetical protein
MLPAGWGGTSTVVKEHRWAIMNSPVLQATCSSDAVAFCASPDYSHLDVPAVLRSRSSSAVLQALTQEVIPYIQFLRRLKQQAARKLTGKVPKTIVELSKLNPPDELVELLKALVSEGYSERDTLVALYACFASNGAIYELGEIFTKRAAAFSKNTAPNPLVLSRLEIVINELWEETVTAQCVASEGRYDIPAFLRR